MIAVRSDAELSLDLIALFEPVEWGLRLRSYFALLGGGADGVGDALELGERGAEPFGSDLDDPAVAQEFSRALGEVKAERLRRDSKRDDALRRAAGLLAVSRARGQVGEMDA